MTGETKAPGMNTGISKEKAIGFLLPIAMAAVFMMFNQYRYENLYGDLDNFGKTTEATVLEKRVVRRGTDRPTFAYEFKVGFTVGEKMRRGWVRVTRQFYDLHDQTSRIPIRYLPDDPQIREVDTGMREHTGNSHSLVAWLFIFIAVVNLFVIGNQQDH